MQDIMEKLGLAQIAETLVGDLRTPGELSNLFAVRNMFREYCFYMPHKGLDVASIFVSIVYVEIGGVLSNFSMYHT